MRQPQTVLDNTFIDLHVLHVSTLKSSSAAGTRKYKTAKTFLVITKRHHDSKRGLR
jgi:hypothetical protein